MDFTSEIDDQKPLRYMGLAIIVLIIGVILSYFYAYHRQKMVVAQLNPPPVVQPSLPVIKPIPPALPALPTTVSYVIKKGDQLTSIFAAEKLPLPLLTQLLKLPNANSYLRQLKPGQTLRFIFSPLHEFQQLNYRINLEKELIIKRQNNGFIAQVETKPITKVMRFKSGVIRHNLASAAAKAGLTSYMVKQLNEMFGSQLNLSKNLHPGDRFNILYRDYFVDGQEDRPGNIVAAEIIGKNKDYRVVRFTNAQNQSHYYMANGQSMESAFLSVPLHYKRISSGFSYRRLDPYLHSIHSHLGIDYAAAYGTPVKALGNGHVVFFGWINGYGKAVVIRYGRIYKTLYGHLEKFAANLRHGGVVKKGQVVGYVGKTGWATGPHLHFELYKNNVPVNPAKVKLSKTTSAIPFEYRSQFLAQSHQLFSQMTTFEQAQNAPKRK